MEQIYLDAYLKLKSRYVLVLASLVIAAVPEAVLYSFYLDRWKPGLRALLLFAVQVPWLVYFLITFIRIPPPIWPQTFRRIILFIVYWYVTLAAVLAITGVVAPRPVLFHSPYEEAVLWVFALSGWAGVPTLLRCSRDLAAVQVRHDQA